MEVDIMVLCVYGISTTIEYPLKTIEHFSIIDLLN